MKLIVEAYDIPLNLTHQIIQNHELSRDDTDLAPGKQVLRAQEVIFSNDYTTMKKIFMILF